MERPSVHDQRVRAVLTIGGVAVLAGAIGVLGPIALLLPIAAVAIVAISIRLPGVVLAAFLLIPYYKGSLSAHVPVDLTVVMAAFAGLQFFVILAYGPRVVGSRLGVGLWVALAVTVIAGVIWTDDQLLGRSLAFLWVALILLPSAASVRVAQRERFVNQFLLTTFLVGATLIVLAIPAIFASDRLSIAGQNTIQTGQIAMLTALIAIFWASRMGRPLATIWSFLIVPVAVIVAVASGSRGPVLGMVIVGVVMVGRWIRGGGRPSLAHARLLAVSAIVVVALAAVVDRLPGASLSRFALLQSVLDASAPTDTSAAARGDLFRVAAQQFAERPLFGNGTGSFATWAHTHVGFTDFTYPHNDLMQFAAELGIIGAALFVGFLIVAFGRRVARTPAWRTISALALFMVINGLVSGDIYGDRLMWGLLVLLVAAPAEIAAHGRPDTSEVAPDRAGIGVHNPTVA